MLWCARAKPRCPQPASIADADNIQMLMLVVMHVRDAPFPNKEKSSRDGRDEGAMQPNSYPPS